MFFCEIPDKLINHEKYNYLKNNFFFPKCGFYQYTNKVLFYLSKK